jgi:CBS domain-containing protein
MKSIREILTGARLVTVPGASNVLEAAEIMKESRIGALLVKDEKTGSLGLFSERDLMTRVVVPRLDPEATSVRSVMTSNIFTATPDQRVNEVAVQMQKRHIRHLPVVENGEIIAMLSLRDLLRAHINVKRNEVRELKSYIQGEG